MIEIPSTHFGELAPASHSMKKREMWHVLAELDTNPEFWPEIIARVSDGEFISEVAKDCQVHYSILRNWIRGNKAREQAFCEAERQGKARRVEKVLEKAHEVALADIEGPPNRMEQLRAMEILLKQESRQPAQHQTFGDITINFVAAKDGKEIKGEVIDQLP